jgi:hypothetical protein
MLGDVDSRRGISHLSRFEHKLEAVITRLNAEKIVPVLAPTAAVDNEIDSQVYAEAVLATAKERDVPVISSGWMGDVSQTADRLCQSMAGLLEWGMESETVSNL